MFIIKYLIITMIVLAIVGCSSSKEKKETATISPIKAGKITMLFITQAHCPSCDELQKTMALNKPAQLIKEHFQLKMMNYDDILPEGLIEPNGTPTVYFLDANDDVLIEPMIGEKNEAELLEFLNDALYEQNLTLHSTRTTNVL